MNEVNHLSRTPEATVEDSDSNSSGHDDPPSDDSDQETEMEVKQDKEKFALQIEPGKTYKRHWGKNFVCCFIKGEPLLSLGPDCKLSIIIHQYNLIFHQGLTISVR